MRTPGSFTSGLPDNQGRPGFSATDETRESSQVILPGTLRLRLAVRRWAPSSFSSNSRSFASVGTCPSGHAKASTGNTPVGEAIVRDLDIRLAGLDGFKHRGRWTTHVSRVTPCGPFGCHPALRSNPLSVSGQVAAIGATGHIKCHWHSRRRTCTFACCAFDSAWPQSHAPNS